MKIFLLIIMGIAILVCSYFSIRLSSHNAPEFKDFSTKYDKLCTFLQVVCIILIFMPLLMLVFKNDSNEIMPKEVIIPIIYVVIYGSGMTLGDWAWQNDI